MDRVLKDIFKVLKETKEALEAESYEKVQDLSNHVIHNASIYQDKLSLKTAVFIYSLGKVLGLEKFRREEEFSEFMDDIKGKLEEMIRLLKEEKREEFSELLKESIGDVSELDKAFGTHLKKIIIGSKVKKASKIYEHGISLGRVAEILGLTEFELMDYIGPTKVHDLSFFKVDKLKEKYEEARGVFE